MLFPRPSLGVQGALVAKLLDPLLSCLSVVLRSCLADHGRFLGSLRQESKGCAPAPLRTITAGAARFALR